MTRGQDFLGLRIKYFFCATSSNYILAKVDPASCLLPLTSFSFPTQQLVTDVATAFSDGPLLNRGKRPLEFREEIMILLIKQAGVGGWAAHAKGESSGAPARNAGDGRKCARL